MQAFHGFVTQILPAHLFHSTTSCFAASLCAGCIAGAGTATKRHQPRRSVLWYILRALSTLNRRVHKYTRVHVLARKEPLTSFKWLLCSPQNLGEIFFFVDESVCPAQTLISTLSWFPDLLRHACCDLTDLCRWNINNTNFK